MNKKSCEKISKTSSSSLNIKNGKNHLRELAAYAAPYKLHTVLIALFALIEAVIIVVSPKITGMAITALSCSKIDFDYVFGLVSVLFALYSGFALCSCLGNYFISFVMLKMTHDLRENISYKMDRISLAYLEGTTRGDILSRIMNDVETLSSAFAESINQLISSVIMGIGVLFMMFYISWEMTAVSLGILPIIVIGVVIILKKSQKYFVEYQVNLGKINGFVEETFSGYEIVKMFNSEEKFIKNFNGVNSAMYNSSWKGQFLSGLSSPIVDLISKISYIAACIMGGYLAVTRGFSIGDISAFIAYSGQFVHPIIQMGSMIGLIQQTFASADRIFEFLKAPEELNSGDIAFCDSHRRLSNESDCVEFKNVSFGYDSEKIVIDDFSFKILMGQSVAIVGETGAGKTTLTKLLMGFYDGFKGEIFLNGKNIKNINLKEYRKNFGLVTQDSWLCYGTIEENIRYGNPSASLREVKRASEFAGASHFIESLPQGYSTIIEENISNISQGQKQLICIARMVLRDAPIFIMDEATSSVDIFTESRIQQALDKIIKNKTSLIIAHRLSTIKNADVIVVMDKGRIGEFGTHKELIEKKGIYYNMYMSQFDL